ncbi:uncharacterized protein K460DRAFT_291697 [Cucurbitaria berberidis CBS 394.84]|uniref:Zn(2)-C6 fungal-type domain-containing protein n=1 Tax=Cucurbitaria berberidis CBS 394.84 TaxID=1168544 RepID=A0A9P4GA77_9PLEO|nr:uncharacterized protein K460DRAFT_291697 [Cucurbitaria berberidis CBS 394.84]KAF1841860.1 hypothetical protein K460DRAFT_291697 [Cucurbitaria berberidis CBS 394.84]
MPKQRQTCTRCSQRRQKCDRKAPCTRCVQNSEGHLCTTKWVNGYNPTLHRKYPAKTHPTVPYQPPASSSDGTASSLDVVSPPDLATNNDSGYRGQGLPSHVQTPTAEEAQSLGTVWPSKLKDITIGTFLSEKDQHAQQGLFDQSFRNVQSRSKNCPTIASYLSSAARAVEIQHVQSLLPSKTQLVQIVEYYEHFMLYWSGGIYHGPTFRKKLLEGYGESQELDLQSLDWRWTGLLFAILSSSIIGSSENVSHAWGFSIDDKIRLAREWGAASLSCLNMGNYTSQYHIYSVHAIYIMHAYEHLGLGLHKLGPHPDDDRILELNAEQKQAFVEREIGRRTWYTLTCQEWCVSYICELVFALGEI